MNPTIVRLSILVALFLLTAGFAFATEAAGDEVALQGEFIWVRDDGQSVGDLEAIFTPDGEEDWDVAFHFVWEDEPHTYLGRANGSFSGPLEGTAKSDGERDITFRFRGEFEDGTFSGTHGWINKEGELEQAGTLTLSLAP